MRLSLPTSTRRHYLTGIDWSMGMLHALTRWRTGVGNQSQVVLDLAGRLDPDQLRTTLQQVATQLPLVHGRVARDWMNLCPYWRIDRRRAGVAFPLRVEALGPEAHDHGQRLMHQHVNQPLPHENMHLSFRLVHLGRRTTRLGMVFDHRLLDAAGAEMFIDLLDHAHRGALSQIVGQVPVTAPAYLDCWKRQFAAGRIVNQRRLEVSGPAVAGLPLPPPARHRPYHFVTREVSHAVMQKLTDLAIGESGAPLLLPSLVGRAAAAFTPALRDSPGTGDQQLIMAAVNQRTDHAGWSQVFFNHLSFMAFSLPVESGADPAGAAKSVGQQLLSQMREDLPRAVMDAAMLTRICPHAIGRRVACKPLNGRMCSFYLAVLPDSRLSDRTFCGLPIRRLQHTPRVPPPPGVGLCLARFGQTWNLTLSWLDTLLTAGEAAALVDRFVASLPEA